MTNEEFQLLVLKELKEIKTDLSGVKSDVSELKYDVSELKYDVSELKSDVSELKSDVSILKADVSELKSQQIRMNDRQDEQHDLLQALLHGQEVANARLEGLLHTTAKIESVQQVQNEVNMLGKKLYTLAVG